MERVGLLDLSFDADFENPALRRTTMIIGGIPSPKNWPKHSYCASIFGQKEGQACFPDFVKGNQLHWLLVPSLLRRSQCIAWNCFFMRILRTIMFWKKQMDCDVPISPLFEPINRFLEEDSPKLPRSHQNNPICTFKTSHSDAELDKVSPYKQIIKNTFSRSPWPTVSLQTKPPLSHRILILICLYLFPAKQINKTFFKLIRLEGSHLKA